MVSGNTMIVLILILIPTRIVYFRSVARIDVRTTTGRTHSPPPSWQRFRSAPPQTSKHTTAIHSYKRKDSSTPHGIQRVNGVVVERCCSGTSRNLNGSVHMQSSFSCAWIFFLKRNNSNMHAQLSSTSTKTLLTKPKKALTRSKYVQLIHIVHVI